MSLIQLSNLSKIFYADEIETHALSEVHLSIAKGEYVSISGPSGCGKSTLLSLLGLLDTPTGGTYQLNGTNAEALKPNDRARIRNKEIGFVFQAFNLIGDLSVFENVELPLTYRPGVGKVERRERAMKARPRNPRLLREVRNIVKTGGSANGMANSGDIRFPESFIYKIGSRLSGARLWAGRGHDRVFRHVTLQQNRPAFLPAYFNEDYPIGRGQYLAAIGAP